MSPVSAPAAASPASVTAAVPVMRGMSFGFMAKRGYYASPAAHAEVEAMAAAGVRWVALMATVAQETFHSTRLFQDFEFTPSDSELELIIARFHRHGIKVMLKPMVECLDSSWRGNISFPNGDEQIQGRRHDYWGQWFASLTQCVAHYAALAERTRCESYCLGCELFAAEAAVHNDRWVPVVAAARRHYAGHLCYDVQPPTLLERAEPPAWLRALDAVCISYYTPCASGAGASADAMMVGMQPTVAKLRAVSQALSLPIIFGETGCRSMAGAAMNPSEYRTAGTYSAEEQANYLEAMCRLFWAEPWWGGFFWWKWDEQQQRPQFKIDPAGDTGWTLQGKAGAQTLRRWFERADRA